MHNLSFSLTVRVSLVRVLCTILPDPLPSGLLALVAHVHRVVEAGVVTHTVVVVVVTIGLRLRWAGTSLHDLYVVIILLRGS